MSNEDDILRQTMHLLNRMLFLEKKIVFQFEGVKLYPSEIHLMGVIADGRGVNATLMAERLGVTKGAVSQTLSRLERKGILVKSKDPLHKNELTARFTPRGKSALEEFRRRGAESHREYTEYLSLMPVNDRTTILEFLNRLERFIRV